MSKTITQIIAEHRGGFVSRRLDDMLTELVTAVQDSGKKGSLTINIALSPHGKNNREVHMRIVPVLRAPPAAEFHDESVWFGVRGHLQRDDPDQRELFGPKGVEIESNDSADTTKTARKARA